MRGFTKFQGIFCRTTCSTGGEEQTTESNIRKWSVVANWDNAGIPVAGADATIETNWNMKLDQNTVKLNKLIVKGILFFDDTVADLTIFAKNIVIEPTGKLMIGSETVVYQNKAKIVLSGARADA